MMPDREKYIEILSKAIKTIKELNEYIPIKINLEFAEDILELLKEREAIVPYMDFDGHDVWRCGKCGATIFHIYHNASDEDAKNYAKFCRHCGMAVKWDA